jgi:uncharacterized Zn finger protein
MNDPNEQMRCPDCSASFEMLTLYLDSTGPFYGCDECGWIEPHGPGVWTAEMVMRLLKEEQR